MHLGLHISKPDQGSHPKNCSKPKCTQCTPHLCSYQTGMTKKIVKKKGGKLQWCCDRWNDVAASSRRMTSLLSCAVHNLCCMLHYTRGPRDEALTRGCRLMDMAQPWVTDHQKSLCRNAPTDNAVRFTQVCVLGVSSCNVEQGAAATRNVKETVFLET